MYRIEGVSQMFVKIENLVSFVLNLYSSFAHLELKKKVDKYSKD